jgi:3-oxoacyl-[acyl-carrier protein] reductase
MKGHSYMGLTLASYSLDGKVVVVSAAGRGIGQGIALACAQLGAKLIVADIDANRLGDTLNQIEAIGGTALPVTANLLNASDAEAMSQAAVDRFGRIDAIANVVGGLSQTDRGPVLEVNEESWDSVVDLNLKTVFLSSKAAARRMIDLGSGGSIINIASISGINRSPRGAHYGAAKAAVIHFTKTLAHELGPDGIRVNAVAPGVIDTPLNREARKFFKLDDDELAGTIPLRRLGTVEDVAAVAAFFASDASSYVTGQTLIVGGGLEVWGN